MSYKICYNMYIYTNIDIVYMIYNILYFKLYYVHILHTTIYTLQYIYNTHIMYIYTHQEILFRGP